MQITTLDQDLQVFHVTAKSFPEGALEAHQKLHAMVPFSKDRNYFGISRPENGPIIYRAAVEQTSPGEAQKYGCELLTLKRGDYVYTMVNDFSKDPRKIEGAFRELLTTPGLDPQGYCVEWYLNDQDAVKCMIRLEQ